jgi:origin recognition complex subunit 5
MMCQLATLVGLRLVVKSGGTGDILEGSTKWRANVGWEMVRDMARGVAFDVESYIIE